MKVDHLIEIDAPPETVWAVTTDIERWPEWTPTVETAKRLDDRPFDVGAAALITQPGLPETKWIVTELTKGERFTWESQIHGAHVIATHEIAAAGAGTQNRLSLEMKGVAAFLLWPLIGWPAKQAIKKENTGLKNYCEGKVATVLSLHADRHDQAR